MAEDTDEDSGCVVTTVGGKRAGAGRPPGATSIRKKVAAMCEEMGLNPTQEIIRIIQDKATAPDVRARLLQDLQQYVAPKLKSIEISGSLDDDGRPIEIVSYKGVLKNELNSPI